MANVNAIRAVMLGGALLLGVHCAWAQDWPQWRGPNRDNHLVGFTAPKTWPKELTKKWTVTVGIGESSPVLVGEKLYVFARQGGDEVIMCLDAGSGKEIWKEKYPTAAVKGPANGFPGTRSTPAVGEGKVCTLGVNGVLCCWDAASGKQLWRKDKAPPQFGTSTSPIIVDGKCIVYAGTLTAFDLATGEEKWNWGDAKTAPYGSPVLMTVDGVKQVVTPAAGAGKGVEGALAGIALADGKLLWKVKLAAPYQSNYSTPLVDGATVIYSETGGKGKGGGGTMALKIVKKDGDFSAMEIWKKPLAAAGYHTPVLKGDLVFGVTGALSFYCMDAKTGETLWTDKEKHGTCGSILDAGSVMLALSSDRKLIVFEPSNKEYKEIARYTVGGDETWAVPIIAGNRVFVKDKGGSLTLLTIE
jgi:outer membrane protein assembly factor BamB